MTWNQTYVLVLPQANVLSWMVPERERRMMNAE